MLYQLSYTHHRTASVLADGTVYPSPTVAPVVDRGGWSPVHRYDAQPFPLGWSPATTGPTRGPARRGLTQPSPGSGAGAGLTSNSAAAVRAVAVSGPGAGTKIVAR